jgi:hypothetical protein
VPGLELLSDPERLSIVPTVSHRYSPNLGVELLIRDTSLVVELLGATRPGRWRQLAAGAILRRRS